MTLKGMDGAEQIQRMMSEARENPPRELAGKKVLALRDYQRDLRTDMITGDTAPHGPSRLQCALL